MGALGMLDNMKGKLYHYYRTTELLVATLSISDIWSSEQPVLSTPAFSSFYPTIFSSILLLMNIRQRSIFSRYNSTPIIKGINISTLGSMSSNMIDKKMG